MYSTNQYKVHVNWRCTLRFNAQSFSLWTSTWAQILLKQIQNKSLSIRIDRNRSWRFSKSLEVTKAIRMAPTYTGDNSNPQLWVTVQIIHLNVIHWQKSKVPEIIDQTEILCEVWDQNRHQPTFQSSSKMVLLNVKHLNNSIFLVETTLTASVDETLAQIIKLHNGILKVCTKSVSKVEFSKQCGNSNDILTPTCTGESSGGAPEGYIWAWSAPACQHDRSTTGPDIRAQTLWARCPIDRAVARYASDALSRVWK